MSEKWTPEAREAKRRYYREYRRKNRDKIREADQRYWQKVAERNGLEKGQARKRQEKA